MRGGGAALDQLSVVGVERFIARVPFTIRLCRVDDLANLEWFGMFRDHRQLIERTFAEMQRGEQLMWVAERHGFPGGQIWLDLRRNLLWAARVFWPLQGCGIGRYLTRTAEAALSARGRTRASVTVEEDNSSALRFWIREGYHLTGRVTERWSYDTPDGVHVDAVQDQQLLEKELAKGDDARYPLDHR